MGVVFEAQDIRLERTVAIKVLQPAISEDVEMRERLREARAASAIDHPNLCTIYTVETAPNGSLLLVMAYYRGQTLELILDGPIDSARIETSAARPHPGCMPLTCQALSIETSSRETFLLNSGQ